MALDFGDNTNAYYVSHGTLGSWNWGAGAGTAIVWFWVDADHDGAEFGTMASKSSAAVVARFQLNFADNSELHFQIGGSTYLTALSNSNPVSTGKWSFAAAAWNPAGAASDQKLYYGDLSTLATEVGGYASQNAGASLQDSSAVNYVSGVAETTPAGEFDGKIALAALYDTNLSLAQIQQQQFSLWPTIGMANLQLFCSYGFNGTGTQTDWSGNGYNGTVTSATLSPHVSLRLARPDLWAVYLTGNPWYYYAQQV